MPYDYKPTPEMKEYLRKRKRNEKIVAYFWIVFLLLAVFSILLSIGTDAYRSRKEFDGSYLKWTDTWLYSDAIDCFGYDYYHDKLVVVFSSSERAYIYSGVESSVVKKLRETDSPGTYYNERIKGKYPSEKIQDYHTLRDKSIY